MTKNIIAKICALVFILFLGISVSAQDFREKTEIIEILDQKLQELDDLQGLEELSEHQYYLNKERRIYFESYISHLEDSSESVKEVLSTVNEARIIAAQENQQQINIIDEVFNEIAIVIVIEEEDE